MRRSLLRNATPSHLCTPQAPSVLRGQLSVFQTFQTFPFFSISAPPPQKKQSPKAPHPSAVILSRLPTLTKERPTGPSNASHRSALSCSAVACVGEWRISVSVLKPAACAKRFTRRDQKTKPKPQTLAALRPLFLLPLRLFP